MTRGASRAWSIAGSFMLAHLLVLCIVKTIQGTHEDVLWMCHVTLGMAGAGLLLRSTWLVSLALICGLVPQALWIVDFVVGRLVGVHPIRLTAFLNDADLLTWLLMSHHFYLMPVLIWIAARRRFHHRGVLPAAVLVAAALTVGPRLALPPERNINACQQLLPTIDHRMLAWANGLDTPRYLLLLNCVISGMMLLPASMVLHELARPERQAPVRGTPVIAS